MTHNMQQAARVSDYAGFMLLGELVEFGVTKDLYEPVIDAPRITSRVDSGKSIN